ncbi:hypothetical protein BS50DRAFT_144735 [Corynespora cassiicola Philippines]|uniref:Uncharacterized protein n=1 Tax=Corynespora cassiicola Philippines TaxID=1448308 RepID=A0A2T2N8D2_CORCC|nr:hypothetical protein BS50DRAFT_144735 [Corynespora cassiicola Philippines]
MKSQDAYNVHLRQKPICDIVDRPTDDNRMDAAKWKEINLNRAPFSHAKDAGEKWTMLFRYIFPDDHEVPSPYEDNSISARFERLLAQTLETELLTRLGPALGNAIEGIRHDLPTIIRSCKDEAANKPSLGDSTLAKALREKRPTVSNSTAGPEIDQQAFTEPPKISMPLNIDCTLCDMEGGFDEVNEANLCPATHSWSPFATSTNAGSASSSKAKVEQPAGRRIQNFQSLDGLTAMISGSQTGVDAWDPCLTENMSTLVELPGPGVNMDEFEDSIPYELTDFDVNCFING